MAGETGRLQRRAGETAVSLSEKTNDMLLNKRPMKPSLPFSMYKLHIIPAVGNSKPVCFVLRLVIIESGNVRHLHDTKQVYLGNTDGSTVFSGL